MSSRIKQRNASEQTPLLYDDHRSDASSRTESGRGGHELAHPHEKPLPKGQIILLCYARMMEPIAFFSIFPFVAQMVQRNGNLPESDVGFYSGLIESIFSATQTLVLIFWGRLADRIGRKPILVYSLCGTAILPALFGLATSIWEMVAFRCLAGVFSGSSLIIRTMIGDHSTAETQALAFSWFAFAANVGIFLGPIIGGALADPVSQYPAIFEGIAFFEKYPYALPGLVVGLISATGALTAALYLEETLDKNQPGPTDRSSDRGREACTNTNGTTTDHDSGKMTIWQLIKAPGVAAVLYIYGHVMFLAFAFTAILPIILFTPVDIGGMGFSAFQISIYMAIQGASQAVWILVAFPFLQRRLGTKGVLRVCAIVYPFFFAGYIVTNFLLKNGSEVAVVWVWIVGLLVAIVGSGVSMAFTGVQLALNDVSPAAHHLGTLNAIALTCASAIRSVVPGVVTAIYAIGVRHQILRGHLAMAILIPMSMALSICLKWLRSDK